jgi:putative N6-adenine-specific DNA methylase
MPNFFAVCAPGLESFTARELVALGLRIAAPPPASGESSQIMDEGEGAGGVEFRGSLADLYRANLHLRTASRVWLQLGSFFADTFSDLGRRAKRLAWEDYLKPGLPVSLRVSCQRSKLFHSGGVAERILGSIGARLGRIPPAGKLQEDPEGDSPPLIMVRLVENRCTASLDSSGALLHRRGYRLATAKAPLRETLAAGMLLASGWDLKSPLLDPFCGAGTIPIEAALMARRIAPGLRRRFAFMDWPNFDEGAWEDQRAEAREVQVKSGPLVIASDRDAGAIQAARENAERAGVADGIDFSCRALSSVDPPQGSGWVVTNAPYGVRLGVSEDLFKLYTRFGRVLRMKCPGWQVTMLGNSIQLLSATGLPFDLGISTRNGGVKVRLARGRVK